MTTGRLPRLTLGKRAAAFAVVALIVGIPAIALRLLCFGGSCETPAQASSSTPFCSLPVGIRQTITESTRDGRSGDLLVVTEGVEVAGGSAFEGTPLRPRWPSLEGASNVPVVLSGAGIASGTTPPAGVGLDDVAPTISDALGFDRPHPSVRSGEAIPGATTSGFPPRLVVLVAWKGVGSDDLTSAPDDWPRLRALMNEGTGTLQGETNALSADPAAALTTLGTGGNPSQHGITGTLLRNETGELVTAWGRRSPGHVIATLAEHLDHELDEKPVIALVGTREEDRGLIGGDWYGFDKESSDLVSMLPASSTPRDLALEARQVLRSAPFARDDVPDLLAVSQEGPVAELDRELGRIVDAVREAAGGDVLVAVAGTGSGGGRAGGRSALRLMTQIEEAVPGPRRMIEAVGPGEIFLDQDALATAGMSDEVVLDALFQMRGRSGQPLFADAFPSVTVTFGRFC